MKVRVIEVRMRDAILAGGKQVPFTAPSVEVGAGEYVRKFNREEGLFTLRGVEEINAVQNSGYFEYVEGTERYEEVEPAPAPESTLTAAEEHPPAPPASLEPAPPAAPPATPGEAATAETAEVAVAAGPPVVTPPVSTATAPATPPAAAPAPETPPAASPTPTPRRTQGEVKTGR